MFDKFKVWLYNWCAWLWLDTIFWASMALVGIYFLVRNN